MYAQVITFDESPDEIELGIDHVGTEVLPALEPAHGLVGLWLVDRESGKRITVMVWDDESEAQAAFARVAARQEGHAGPRPTPSSAGRYEVYGRIVNP
jgi:hypothetical protein